MVVDRSSHSTFNIRPTFREHYPDQRIFSTSISISKETLDTPGENLGRKGNDRFGNVYVYSVV